MAFTETNVGVSQGGRGLILKLKEAVGQLFGIHTDEIDDHASFLDMGADSLSLLRVSQILQEKFNVKIPFRSLLEELSSISELAAHIESKSAIETQPPQERPSSQPLDLSSLMPELTVDQAAGNGTGKPVVTEPDAALAAPSSSSDELRADSGTLERILAQQMRLLSEQMQQQSRIMSMQLEMLQAARLSSETASAASRSNSAGPGNGNGLPIKVEPPKPAKNGDFETEAFVAYHAIKKEKQRGLTSRQQEHVDRLIEQVTARTKESKRLTQTYRQFLADSRTAAGFRPTWKEMCYPLVIDRGQGSHVYDVDGNEYVDLTMGFGALLFGHSPDFLVSALQEAVAEGVRLGGQSHIVGQTAQLICELTGVERVAFCNSGTEAVMSALRLARTVTGRTRIALFEGSYHGTFDGVMVRPGESAGNGTFNALPLAPGVPQHMIENVLLLGYDDAASLEVIRANAHELAAVLIEPPRSRHPEVQPRAFLHELRKITEESGAALIFDEVVTGFRFHPGGVQALFDVQADLVTYGKAIGGGVPVAVVGGKAKFM
ncbi:MAG TPA: aminotransferase class III-fold pyridoxal phosphate-dependent enzyme, partial [Pyrinomonadaceae bacterium]|nr:aminotransferase class III-fold pyridoxal phosphate-dependent enzyme [Pyrinomonadaceae bacterium]